MVLASGALAQPAPSVSFDWEVRNRFRLFSHEADFEKHVAAWKLAGAGESRVLASERGLAGADGHGWARHMRVCVNRLNGRLLDNCERVDLDGEKLSERMVNPRSHRIKFEAAALPDGAVCVWSLGKGFVPARIEAPCAQSVSARLRNGASADVSLSARLASGAVLSGPAQKVEARDVLIVGMGDSIASGEGNPVSPAALRGDGFCYRRFFSSTEEFFLPSRELAVGVLRDCPGPAEQLDQTELFEKTAAGWLYAQCHRSLYSHQTRTALALAVENRNIAVTYIPLGCSGAEIIDGMTGAQKARERPYRNGQKSGPAVEAQFTQLKSYIGRGGAARRPDLVLLTVGANDIGFGGLVADATLSPGGERDLLDAAGMIVTPPRALALLDGKLRKSFARLRSALAAAMGDISNRIVFTAYGNPAMDENGDVCQSSRRGFDAHPAFAVDGAKIAAASAFVENKFIPKLRAYAQCLPGGGCARAAQSMVFVETHRPAFARHGFCAASPDDPAFDRDCFHNGGSFEGGTQDSPMRCLTSPAAFRAYAKRERWIRTANDSYFAAMTHSAALPLQPPDIHDALWGLSAVVHGGAIHPTAEGHAAMADAVLVSARKVLKLPAPP